VVREDARQPVALAPQLQAFIATLPARRAAT